MVVAQHEIEKDVPFYVDGKEVREELSEAERDGLPIEVLFGGQKELAFTTHERFTTWLCCSDAPPGMAERWYAGEARIQRALAQMEELGDEGCKLYEQLEELYEAFDAGVIKVKRCLPKLDRALSDKELVTKYHWALPRGAGSVLFYKHAKYKENFHWFRGMHHISCPKMGKYNNSLSSLHAYAPAEFVLCGGKNFGGKKRWVSTAPLVEGTGVLDVPYVGDYWNDRTSSYYFIGPSIIGFPW